MNCERCNLLSELYDRTPKSERDYWIMTELFVLLHGSDICTYSDDKCVTCDIFSNKNPFCRFCFYLPLGLEGETYEV